MRLVGLLPEPGSLAERRRYPGDPCLVKWKTGVTFDIYIDDSFSCSSESSVPKMK